jgi:hypothetical protein
MPVAKTYTICLCDHGKEFRRIPNVVDDERSRPKTGDVIDRKWLVLGVRSQTATEIVVDVEEVARTAN